MSETSHTVTRRVRPWWKLRNHRTSPCKRTTKLNVEGLEDRFVPATFVQTGGIVTAEADLLHRYDFNNSLSDIFSDGPALVAHGGTVAGGRYTFGANQGLQLNGGLAGDASSYSIELVMEFDALLDPEWKKVLDFLELENDDGLYVFRNTLALYPNEPGPDVVTANTDFHVVITRDGATGLTRTYLNGVFQAESDTLGISPNNTLIFFEDDIATVGGEAESGSVAYIAIYNGPLSDADVAALNEDRNEPGPTAVSVVEGQTATMSGTFHNSTTDAVTVSSSIGTVTQSSGDHGTWSWSFLADDGPAQNPTVTITANANGSVSTTTFTLTVDNVAPTASLANSGPVSEGSTATVTFTNQVDPSTADLASLHYAYDFDNDGTFDLGDGTYAGSGAASSATVLASFLADGPGSRTVGARVIDDDGGSNDYTTTITINNAAPSLAADHATFTVGEGQNAVATGTFGDPGDDTVSLAVSLGSIFDNGDGTWSWSFPTLDGPDNSHTVTVTATDSDDDVTTITFELVVNNLAPTVAADQPSVTVNEGQTAGNSGTFGDPGVDSVTLAASVGAIVGHADGTWSWSFATNDGPAQSQMVTVTATDSDGASTTTTFALVVNNLPPTVAANQASVTVNEGQTAGNSGTFGDPGVDAVSLTASVGAIVGHADGTWSWSFATNDGPAQSQMVTVTATDSDGASTTTTFALVVNNLPPTVAANQASVTVNEGQTAGNSGTFGDPGVDAVSLTASVGAIVGHADGTWSWSFATNDGPAQSQMVTVTATDSNGAVSTATFDLVVNNVAPTIDTLTSSATSSNPALTGTPVTVQGSFSDLGTADTHHAVITWGDGAQTVLNESDINQTANTFTANHAYVSAGTFTVTVTLFDDDGDQAVGTTTAVVVAPPSGGSVTVHDRTLFIVGTSGSDYVLIELVANNKLKVSAEFLDESVKVKLADVDKIVVELGEGNDWFEMAGNVKLPAVVHGGAGNDWLKSGGGPSVLLGDAGDDQLKGAHGRDILVGGVGRDLLEGGEGDDVLIGGTTNIDHDNDALFAALALWSSDHSFAARSAAFKALVSVSDDSDADVLQAGGGCNLVFHEQNSQGVASQSQTTEGKKNEAKKQKKDAKQAARKLGQTKNHGHAKNHGAKSTGRK